MEVEQDARRAVKDLEKNEEIQARLKELKKARGKTLETKDNGKHI